MSEEQKIQEQKKIAALRYKSQLVKRYQKSGNNFVGSDDVVADQVTCVSSVVEIYDGPSQRPQRLDEEPQE